MDVYNGPKWMEGMKNKDLKNMEVRKEQVPIQMEKIKDLDQVYKDPKWMERMGDSDKGYIDPKWRVEQKQEDKGPKQMWDKMDGNFGVKMERIGTIRGQKGDQHLEIHFYFFLQYDVHYLEHKM